MSFYNKGEWVEFRNGIIESDGYCCKRCGKNENEAIFQVHHKRYIKGRKPWEYAPQDCITLCKGCHAAEHGIIKPLFGWEYYGNDDLGDLIGTCEHCGTSIRHIFIIHHENWGVIEVGTYCCDKLTDSTLASNCMESSKSFENRQKTFLNSKRWTEHNGIHKIRQNLFDIKIEFFETFCFLTIHNLKSNKKYKSLQEAKLKAFETIESGDLIEYLKKKNISFQVKKDKKK